MEVGYWTLCFYSCGAACLVMLAAGVFPVLVGYLVLLYVAGATVVV
jgi:hypothetical protein